MKTKIKKWTQKWVKTKEKKKKKRNDVTLTTDEIILQKSIFSNVDCRRWRWFWRDEDGEGFSTKEKGQGRVWCVWEKVRMEGRGKIGKTKEEKKCFFFEEAKLIP